jgi:hypothetical protein
MSDQTPTLHHPSLLSLHEYWLSQCAGGIPPSAADLKPAELRPWIGNLLIMDVTRGDDFIYSYYGQTFADAFGEDRVGQSIASLPEAQRRLLQTEYEQVRLEGRPLARLYTAVFDGVPATWERLVLPLSSDGAGVDKLMVAAYEIGPSQPAARP